MTAANSTEKRAVHFRVLSDDQVERIKRAAFDVMQTVGFDILDAEACKMLKAAGAWIRGQRVKVPEHIVLGCLATTPKGWTIYDRQGRRALDVRGSNSYYGTATAAPTTRDPLTGELHPTTLADLASAARVADGLEHIEWVMPMGSAQDFGSQVSEVHEFETVVTNTTKPIVFIGYTPEGAQKVFEMAAAVAGGMDNLRQKPFVISYPEPISPLKYPADVIGRLFVSADLSMPIMTGPAVQMGATGPMTLTGAIVQGLAESLMGLVLAQLRRPGCPCGLGINLGVLDMSSALVSVGAPEMSLGLAAQAEVARSLGLPTWGLAGSTDSKTVDAQAGAESAFSILAQGLAGLNLIHDVGYMDGSMVVSIEQMILGNEIIGMARRFIGGTAVNNETLALEEIAAVGPGGHFLDRDHTMDHFRNELWMPRLMTRQPYNTWAAEGAKDTQQRIRDKAAALIDDHHAPALAADVQAELEKIKRAWEETMNLS